MWLGQDWDNLSCRVGGKGADCLKPVSEAHFLVIEQLVQRKFSSQRKTVRCETIYAKVFCEKEVFSSFHSVREALSSALWGIRMEIRNCWSHFAVSWGETRGRVVGSCAAPVEREWNQHQVRQRGELWWIMLLGTLRYYISLSSC